MKNSNVWQFFSSIKLTIVIFILLAVFSMFGTIIPQGGSEQFYIFKYGKSLYKVLSFLNVFDIYHSLVFQVLILTLAVNIIICSLDRIEGAWSIAFKKEAFNIQQFKQLKNKIEIESKDEKVQEKAIELFKKHFSSKFQTKDSKESFSIFGEKGRYSVLGVYVVHLGVLFIIIGALIGSIFGFDAFVNIKEGEGKDSVLLRKINKEKKIPFTVFCKSFNISYYEDHDNMPKEYKSSLVIQENGKNVLERDIVVNSPLSYKGITFYQSSYDTLPSGEISLDIEDKKTGLIYTKIVSMGKPFDLPKINKKSNDKLVILSFEPNLVIPMMGNLGPGFVGLLQKNKKEEIIYLPNEYPRFDRMRDGDFVFSVASYEKKYITGLQVIKDPGVIFVYIGFVLMIIGSYMSFFIPHQKLCISIFTGKDKKQTIFVAGTNKKYKSGMQRKIYSIEKGFLGEKDNV